MSKEIKEEFYKAYLITITINETDKIGKYLGNGRNFWGQTNPPAAVIDLPSYHFFGDNPDELIQEIKSKIDMDFD